MKSRDSISTDLTNIANNLGYQGEVVDVAVGLLSYVLYTNQVEILNAIQESSLSTAKLMNSKITECMNNMYSVYRGKNSRVKLTFNSNTYINKSKGDLVYSSNTFRIYATEAINITPSVNEDDVKTIIGVISKVDKIVMETEVTDTNKYFIDLYDSNNHIIGDVDEEVRVFIKISDDWIEYPTTRNFYDHVNTQIQPIEDRNDLDPIFVLTIPGYGIRLFKRGFINDTDVVGYFPVNSRVRIETYGYTVDEDINANEFDKINLKGCENLEKTLINYIPREDSKSILYNANAAQRTSKMIRSNSDVAVLFSEYFIEEVKFADIRFNQEGSVQTNDELETDESTLYVFYIPRDEEYIIPEIEVDQFIDDYRNYLVTESLYAYSAVRINIPIEMEIELSDTNEITDEIEEILSNYSSKLTERSAVREENLTNLDQWNTQYYNQMIDINEIRSKIAKISNVISINNLQLNGQTVWLQGSREADLDISYDESGNPVFLTSWYDSINEVRIPVYYTFDLQVRYKYSYESVSKR